MNTLMKNKIMQSVDVFQSNAVTLQKVYMHADVDFTTYIESGVRLYVSTGECGTNLTMVVRML